MTRRDVSHREINLNLRVSVVFISEGEHVRMPACRPFLKKGNSFHLLMKKRAAHTGDKVSGKYPYR